MKKTLISFSLAVVALTLPQTPLAHHGAVFPDLYEASVLELQQGLDGGIVFERRSGQAACLDKERSLTGKRSLLHGIPVLLKDNIATVASEGLNTTAGSFSLLNSIVPSDAGVVKRYAQPVPSFGKANLSEFAHSRGSLPSGWSGRGGQNTGAYFPSMDPCGSSSGSGVAASSITCPSSHNNVAGIKPTVGLTSRAGVVPISSNQDTVGPMTRSLTDAAIVLSIIAGPDPNDNFTLAQPTPVPDYTQALVKTALNGKRIGVPRRVFLDSPEIDQYVLDAFEGALDVMRQLGATVVDPADLPSAEELVTGGNETIVLDTDFKVELNRYYAALIDNPSGVRSLADLIAFNDANPELEEPVNFTSQDMRSEATNGFDDAYFTALAFDHDLGRTRGIDAALQAHDLDALVLPSPAFTTTPAAVAGYPLVTERRPSHCVPAPNVPFGISFFASAFSEFELVGLAFAYEQATQTRLAKRAFDEAIPKTQLSDIVHVCMRGKN
ncbi:amidase signature enzyme [Mucidula mucida]|nr:amidase signature enzyme [Mucidula mucida]